MIGQWRSRFHLLHYGILCLILIELKIYYFYYKYSDIIVDIRFFSMSISPTDAQLGANCIDVISVLAICLPC